MKTQTIKNRIQELSNKQEVTDLHPSEYYELLALKSVEWETDDMADNLNLTIGLTNAIKVVQTDTIHWFLTNKECTNCGESKPLAAYTNNGAMCQTCLNKLG